MSKSYYSLGLMSGTSMDGVDASVIQTDGKSEYTAILDKYYEYPKSIYKNLTKLRDKIRSLKDLKTDYIDIFQLHDPSMALLQEDQRMIKTLESLKQEGKIRIIGISTKSPEESLIAIEQFNFKGIQVNFNLIDQRALDNGLFKKCEELGVGIIGRTPLCFGFLTGQYSANDNYDASDHRSLWSREQVDRWANAYKLFSKEFTGLEEQTNTQIALRYCLSYPMLSTTIPGMLTEEQVDENTSSSNYGIFSDSQLQKFRNIYQKNDFFVRPIK